jgi:ketosteroid isomerase-like protein
MEKAALQRWTNGDPSGYLEIYADDIVYFDPFLEKRMDGLEAINAYYEQARGKIVAEKFELLNPVVQTDGKLAVLTFNYQSYNGEKISKWNCTEVYRFEEDGNWKICQSHWSLTQPFNK